MEAKEKWPNGIHSCVKITLTIHSTKTAWTLDWMIIPPLNSRVKTEPFPKLNTVHNNWVVLCPPSHEAWLPAENNNPQTEWSLITAGLNSAPRACQSSTVDQICGSKSLSDPHATSRTTMKWPKRNLRPCA